jgi:L-asparaginase II
MAGFRHAHRHDYVKFDSYACDMNPIGGLTALPVEGDFPSGPAVVYIYREQRVESVHAAAICVADPEGRIDGATGDVSVPVFIRSCAKPFIAAAIVHSGAAEHYELSDAEVAIIAGSHNGEPHHVAAVRSILRKAHIPESALRCGAHPPRDDESAEALRRAGHPYTEVHNNCSGKHAGLLMLARELGGGYDEYLDAGHPAQRYVLQTLARLTGRSAGSIELATDGCGIPVAAISLRELAMAYARLATLECVDVEDANALRRVRDAMRAQPQYVGGTNHFDTALMRVMNDSLISKRGAEGVQGLGSLALRRGAAIKIIDGSARALPPAVLGLLRKLDLLERIPERVLAALTPTYVRSVAGTIVGRIVVNVPM